MNVLFTCTGSWGTGSFNVCEAVMDELTKMGHKVKLIFPDLAMDSPDAQRYYEDDRFVIWPFPLEKDSITLPSFPLMIPDPHPRSPINLTFADLSDAQWNLYLESFEEKFDEVIKDFKPDVVECQHIWAMDMLVGKKGFPYVCASHSSDQLGFEFDKKMQQRILNAPHKPDLIFALTEPHKERMEKMYGFSSERFVVLQNGFMESVFKPMDVNREDLLKKLNLTIPKGAPILCFAGKLSLTKGIDVLLKSNAIIQKAREVHTIVLGAGDLKDIISNIQGEYSVESMHFVGHQSPDVVAKIMNMSSLCLMPSRSEGFPISALEAMACGLPIVATECGGSEEYIVGEVVNKENHQGFADSIITLLDMSAEETTKLRAFARRESKSYSWYNITERRLECYEKILLHARSKVA